MVAPANVQPLVEEDIVPLPFLQIRGQVDPWPQKPQHKGRGDLLGQVDPLSQRHRAAQPQEQPEVRRCRPGGQDQRAGQPDPGGNLPDIRLGRLGRGRRFCRVSFRGDRRLRLRRGVHRGEIGDGAHGLPRLHRRRLRPGKERRRRRQGHRTHKPNEHNAPERIGDDLGRLLEWQAQQQKKQYDHAGREAHIENLRKDAGHGFSSPLMPSIMVCSAAISSEESRFREENAAKKAGREPWKVSSTNSSLFFA